jgi:hypothetical protein
MRHSMTFMGLAAKVGSGLLQLSGIMPTINQVGLKNFIRGVRAIYGSSMTANPVKAWRNLVARFHEITAKSLFMKNRLYNFNRDFKELYNHANKLSKNKAMSYIQTHAFDIIAYAQMSVDLPTWAAGYEEGLIKFNGDDKKAIDHADHIVRLTQGSGKQTDLSQLQTHSEISKLFTTFFSWFNTMFNLGMLTKSRVKRAQTTKEALGIAASFLGWTFFGATTFEILLNQLCGKGPDSDDDEEEWIRYLGSKYLGFWTGQIPILRDATAYIMNRQSFDFSSIFRGPIEITQAVQNLVRVGTGNVDKADELAVGLVRSLGYAKLIPTEPVAQALDHVLSVINDEDPDKTIRQILMR